jgi:TonB family protein
MNHETRERALGAIRENIARFGYSHVAACIVCCLIGVSTVVCASTTFADDDPQHLVHAPAPATAIPKGIIIPADVAAGMLIHKVDPEYPKKAKKARISGIVILRAKISKTGEISDIHAECGPQILQESSLKAVREWKYRPYLYHGEPVAVDTMITVTFSLGDKKKLPFSKDSCPVQ